MIDVLDNAMYKDRIHQPKDHYQSPAQTVLQPSSQIICWLDFNVRHLILDLIIYDIYAKAKQQIR